VNQPLASGSSGSIQSRLTADVGRQRSHIDVIEGDHGSIDPTIALHNEHGTTLTLHGRWSQVLQQDYSGLPILGTIKGAPYTIDPDLFPASPDIPRTRSQVQSIDATLEQRFGEHVTLTVPMQYAKSSFYQYGQYLFTANPSFAPVYAMDSAFVSQELEEFSITPTLTCHANWDGIHSTTIVGADFDHTTESGVMIGGSAFPLVDVTNFTPPPYVLDPALATYIDADNVYRSLGAFAQTQATFADWFTVVGGVRYAYVQIRDRDRISGDQTYSENRLLPRIGVIAQATDMLSIFADYGEGFRAFPYSQFTADPKPEESDQIEAGIKLTEDGLVDATVAVFQLTRTNVNTADPLGGPLQVQTGEQRSRGAEFDLQITPNEYWTIVANYALTGTKVTQDSTYEGNDLMGIPRHAGRLWIGYAFAGALEGLGIGGGITAMSAQQVDIANTAKTPSHVTVDAGAHYIWNAYTISVGAKNLFDKEYYEPNSYIGGPRVTPGEPLTLVGSLEATF
jgi:iron complex outermembrane receptor protein